MNVKTIRRRKGSFRAARYDGLSEANAQSGLHSMQTVFPNRLKIGQAGNAEREMPTEDPFGRSWELKDYGRAAEICD